MYTKELEELIDSVLADGVITDQERAVLRKRAQACGEDPDEVMIIVEGRLAKMKKATSSTAPATEKRGNIVKCPNCGAPVEPGSIKCKECGYVFTNVHSVSSINKLYEKLTEIEAKRTEGNEDEIYNQASSLVKAFPIPTAKEDIIEFLTTASTYIEDGKRLSPSLIMWLILSIILIVIGAPLCLFAGSGIVPLAIGGYILYNKFYKQSYEKRMAKVWKAKVSQIVAKARFTLEGEPEYEKIQALTKVNRKPLIIGSGIVGALILVGLIYMLIANLKSKSVEPQAKAQYEQLMKKLDALETPDELNYKEVESALLKITWTDIDGDRSDYKENYLKKKRTLARQIGAVEADHDNGYDPISKSTYADEGAPDEIRFPDSYIEN